MSAAVTTPLTVVLAPDTFKGSLTAAEAALAMAVGARPAAPVPPEEGQP